MSSHDSISRWLEQLKAGDRQPVRHLLSRYFQRVQALADKRLGRAAHLNGMEEDIALSAIKSLCMGAEGGKYPRLEDRDDLWRLLCVITIRKTIDLQRRKNPAQAIEDEEINQFLSEEPSPQEAADMAERVRHLLDALDPELRQIAVWKVDGCSNEEIASRLGCVERSVERKLQRIRLQWAKEVPA